VKPAENRKKNSGRPCKTRKKSLLIPGPDPVRPAPASGGGEKMLTPVKTSKRGSRKKTKKTRKSGGPHAKASQVGGNVIQKREKRGTG